MKSYEKQEGGSHYKSLVIEPWAIIDANGLDYFEGNVIKYILRKKGGTKERIEDLKKAIHYIEHIIEVEELKQ